MIVAKRKARQMDEAELKAIVRRHIKDGIGFNGSEISSQRAKALDYYYGRPFGDEVEGRSRVVSRDVADTIEWIMPSLLRIFTSSDEFIRFDPIGKEDEEAAKQETAYCNHVVASDNNGFKIFYDWFKDALLSKTGIVTWYWDDSQVCNYETYKRLTTAEMGMLLADSEAEIEVVAHSEYDDPVPPEMLQAGPDGTPALPDGAEMVNGVAVFRLHDIRIKRKEKLGREKIIVIPPEDFFIDSRARDIDSARMVGHKVRKTISDLREMGYDDDLIDGLDPQHDAYLGDEEDIARDPIRYQSAAGDDDEANDDSTRELWLYRLYLRVDYDGDGIAELRRVDYCCDTILANDEADSFPYADLCPVPMPHRFVGQSVADLVMDLQRIKSTLWRQALDNVYLANNPMKEVAVDFVNIDDLLEPRIGGLVRSKQIGSVVPIETRDASGTALQMLEYVDTIRENRTGVTRYNQGLDADSLNKTAKGINQILNQAQQRIELIARIFAETGVKRLMLGIHEDLMKHQVKERIVKLTNGYVTVNPSQWRTRMDMTVTVGLGTGNKDQNLQNLVMIAEFQQKAAASGANIVTPKNAYHIGIKIAENAGFKDPESFFTDPDTMPPAPADAAPDPMVEAAKITAHGEAVKAQIGAQSKDKELEVRMILEREKLAMEERVRLAQIKADNETKLAIEMMRQNGEAERAERDPLLTMAAQARDAARGSQQPSS
jgi:hypothetical protein